MKKNALQKIEDHEKLCRIMQKQTHQKINAIEKQICRIETILLTSVGFLITGMASMLFMLITK
jgi:hypothetical protein|tara:strand:+ start:234 stop:422 length:189 start_codon:yes stop_codon:yes gene_type:complete